MGALFRRNGRFRIFMGYEIFSALGGGIFSFFMLLSVHMLYGNALFTGVAGFLMAAPFVFSVVVGPLVDRGNKVAFMRATTFVEFVMLALLAFTPLLDALGVVFMFGVILVYSVAMLFEGPSATALLPQIVGEDDILQANSLMQIAAFAGGIGVAAILFFVLDENVNLHLIYGVSAGFVASAFLFTLFLRDPSAKARAADAPKPRYWAELLAGAQFLRGNVLLYIGAAFLAKRIVVEIGAVNLPAFAEYHAGVAGYVLFAMLSMAGGIFASALVGSLGKQFAIGKLWLVLFVAAGVVRIFFVQLLPANFNAGLGILMLFAALSAASNIIFSTMLQKLPPKDMIARISTLNTTVFAIFVALGALVGGVIGRAVPNVDLIFMAQGVVYVVLGAALYAVPSVRRLPKIDDIHRAADPPAAPPFDEDTEDA